LVAVAAAFIFTLCAVAIASVHIALAAGAPWGDFAMGGKFPGKFPPFLRGLAIVQTALVIFFAGIVLVRAELILPQYFEHAKVLIWFVMAFRAMGVVANLATSTKKVRNIWGPAAVAMLMCSVVVALG
jgi:hypothetical protein